MHHVKAGSLNKEEHKALLFLEGHRAVFYTK